MSSKSSEGILQRAARAVTKTWGMLTRPFFVPDSLVTLRRVQLFSSLILLLLLLSLLGAVIGFAMGSTEIQFFIILGASVAALLPLYLLSRTKLYSIVIVGVLLFLFAFPFYAIVARSDFSDERVRSVLGWLVAVYLLGASLLSLRVNLILVFTSIVATLLLPIFVPELNMRAILPGFGLLLTVALLILANVIYRDTVEADRTSAIREAQETYRAVVDHSLQGLAIYQFGCIVFANQAYANILGYSPEELYRLTPDQVMGLVHPDDRVSVPSSSEAESPPSGSLTREIRVLRKDGSIRWVKTDVALIHYRGAPALQAAAVDISENQRASQIQAAIYQIAEAAQNAQDLNAFYEAVHRIACELMPARNFYIALYDPIQEVFNVAYRRDDFDRPDEWLSYKPGKGLGAYILRTGQPILVTPEKFQQMEQAGEVEIMIRRMVDFLGAPLKTARGVIGVMAVQTYSPQERLSEANRDVLAIISTQVATAIERKQAQMEREKFIRDLETKNTELERFTYTVSHDLRSPIITIRGFLGYLEKAAEAGDMTQFRADMERVVNATDKMEDLLNDLLELSRIGRIVNPPRKILFNMIVSEALLMVGGQVQKSRASVNVQEGMPTVYGDKARLVEVVQNLLDNAIKFCGPQPPKIEIGCTGADANGQNIFFVRDHGIGIAPKHFQNIFGLFNQLTPRSPGTGIGLAIVKRIIEVEGGRIWVESEGEGNGATFWFTLPADSA